MLSRRANGEIRVPGLATAHSHAFQRALRGRTQRRATGSNSFWSWRGLMYQLAERLNPERIYALSRLAYAELAMAGVSAVGEFHYVHHQPNGRPYDDRVELAEAVIRAARDVGLRISLLRVLYQRAGKDAAPEGAQRRFCDPDIDLALGDVETLRSRHRGDPMVAVGLAPHSVRAVPRDWLKRARDFAEAHDLPLHMHVSEQRRELEECRREHGTTPVRLLAEDGLLSERFVAVHATHLDDQEVAALGAARALVCVCRTTERDLGDGLCRSADLHSAGARLCTGTDSHASSDPFEEARAIELDDRSRTESRLVVADATELLRAAGENGYRALGIGGASEDQCVLDATDIALCGASDDILDDAVVYASSPRCVRAVEVGGIRIVDGGTVDDLGEIVSGYQRALRECLES